MLPYNVRLNATNVREYAGGSSVGGILRKTGHNNNSNISYGNSGNTASHHDARQLELLVFGYACKIFRDDDKARNIDQGKHLIPWMGDANLKIDRYDVRGALYDLVPHEAPPGGYGNRLDYLSADEQRAEQLCEEERYLYLFNNEEKHILQQEEDLKRLKQETEGGDFSQVDFQYGIAQQQVSGLNTSTAAASTSNTNQINNDDGGEQPFVPPSNFEFAAHLNLPDTMKQHAIIEKTARFIASQGVQMEILLKAKQSNNVQFEFLNQNSLLNPFYKFIVEAIKQGTYPEETDTTTADANKTMATATSDTDPNGIGFNWPAGDSDAYGRFLSGATGKKPPITVPTIKYKPSANCAYTQLISKIKGVPLQSVIDEDSNNSGTFSPATSNKSSHSSSTEFTPVLLRYNGSTFTHGSAEDGEALNGGAGTINNEADDDKAKGNSNQSKVEILKNTSALALAQNYCSDTDDSDNNDDDSDNDNDNTNAKNESILNPELTFPIPEENLQHIIDKTATYVIKNGRQFEETLRAKSVERFTFLLPDNEYYPYYMYKITNDPNAASKDIKARKAAAVAAALISKKGLSGGVGSKVKAVSSTIEKAPVPVSFSIKAKDELMTLQPALPQDPSDDDDDEDNNDGGQKRNGDGIGSQLKLHDDIIATYNDDDSGSASGSGSNGDRHVPERVQKAIQMVEAQLQARSNSSATFPLSKSEVTSPEHNRQKEIKKAEEKFKDKLALIAREKLGGLLTKEKQLQLERKRKAMAFLNHIKSGDSCAAPNTTSSRSTNNNPSDEATTENTNETNLKLNVNDKAPIKRVSRKINNSNNNDNDDEDDDDDDDDSDASSVRSIPITSYGPEEDDDNDEGNTNIMVEINHQQIGPVNRPKSPVCSVAPSNTKSSTVLLSDDDDVQLIGETHAASASATSSIKAKYKKKRKQEEPVIEIRRHRDHTRSHENAVTASASRTISKHKTKKRTHKDTIQVEEYRHHHHHHHQHHRHHNHNHSHHSSRKRRRHGDDQKHLSSRSHSKAHISSASSSSLASSTVSSGTNDSSTDTTTTSSDIMTSDSEASSIDSYSKEREKEKEKKKKRKNLSHKKLSKDKKKSSSESMISSRKRREKSPSRRERSTTHRHHHKHSEQRFAFRGELVEDVALLRHQERERERDRDRVREREREREQERSSRKYQYREDREDRDDRDTNSRHHRHHRIHTPPIANNKMSKRSHHYAPR